MVLCNNKGKTAPAIKLHNKTTTLNLNEITTRVIGKDRQGLPLIHQCHQGKTKQGPLELRANRGSLINIIKVIIKSERGRQAHNSFNFHKWGKKITGLSRGSMTMHIPTMITMKLSLQISMIKLLLSPPCSFQIKIRRSSITLNSNH